MFLGKSATTPGAAKSISVFLDASTDSPPGQLSQVLSRPPAGLRLPLHIHVMSAG